MGENILGEFTPELVIGSLETYVNTKGSDD